MTEKQALYYKICYEKGNIASAAEALFVSRSVVSRMVSDLEKEFGVTFFTRGKLGVKPTKAGDIMYKGICDAMKTQDALARKLREAAKE